MTRPPIRRALCGAAVVLLALAGSAGAQVQPVRRTQEGIVLNFQNLDLGSVVTALAQAAGINVVSSNLPQTQITFRTVQPMPPEDLPGLIRRLAEVNGVMVVEQENFTLLQGPSGEGEVLEPRDLYIYRLKHARAGLLAATLSALFGGAIPSGNTGPQAAQTLSQRLSTMEQASAAGAAGLTVTSQGSPITLQLGGGGELEGQVTIVPDELTNSLLVRARPADYAIIEQAVEALDLRPLQVVIEVVIAEVSTSDDLNLGVSFIASDVDPETGEGTVGVLPGEESTGSFTLDILRTGDIDVNATLSALASTGNVQILSRPLIQAQNNQEARILVGSERPFVQASYSSVNTTGVSQEVVQYRDVGTALTILPTINEEGYVNLLLTQEVSSATAETQFGAPVISTREATTQILARSGQTVVIGGLVAQQIDEVRTGIPLLKDIPILGWLFGSTRESVSNAELFLFLTPYVVADDQDAELLRQEIERNAELLQQLLPIRTLLPPVIQIMLPDSIVPDTIRRDTIPPDTMRVGRPGTGGR